MYKDLINKLYGAVKENEALLNELDAKNGDGEHGLNLRKSFDYILKNFEDKDYNFSQFLIKLGMLFLSAGGGTACTLYGAFIRRFGKELKGKEIEPQILSESAKSIVDEIRKRGQAELGQKTMLDSIEPAVNAFSVAILEKPLADALKDALKAAEEGLEETKNMIGTKGRAYYAGERAKGTYDPGAKSFCIMLTAVTEFVEEKQIQLK